MATMGTTNEVALDGVTPAEHRRFMKKVRRRLHRFIKTGKPVARCRLLDEGGKTYAYVVKHSKEVLTFKLDAANRLRLVHVPADPS